MILCLFTPQLPEGSTGKLLDLLRSLSDRVWQGDSFFYLQVPTCDREVLAELGRRASEILRRPVGVGAAEGPTLAQVAARISLGKEPTVIPRGKEIESLAQVPLHTVVEDRRAVRRLDLLGIATLGDLASADPALTAAYLGQKARPLLRLAKGEELSCPPPAPRQVEVRRKVAFREPPEDLQALLQVLARPLHAALSEIASRGMHPSSFELGLRTKVGPSRHLRLQLAPHEDSQTLLERVAGLLLSIDLSGQVSSLNIVIVGQAVSEEQLSLLPLEARKLSDDSPPHQVRLRQEGETIVKVKADSHGHPTAFVLRGRTYRILEVVNNWRIDLGWWDERTAKDFFKVLTSDGSLWTLSHDLLGKVWRLERLHD